MAESLSAPSSISRRLAPCRSSGSATCASRNAAIAGARSPSCSRISPSVNQAEANVGASSVACSRQAIAYVEELRLDGVTIKLHPAGHVLGSAQIAVSCKDTCIVASGDYKNAPDPTCPAFELVPCDVFITEATFGLPVFRHGEAADEIKKLLASVALFPERAHLVGAYTLGKAQRVIWLLRAAGYDAPIYLHGAMEKITRYYQSRGVALGELRPVKGMRKSDLAGTITLAPPSATADIWTRRFPDPVPCFASGWMRVRARARQ